MIRKLLLTSAISLAPLLPAVAANMNCFDVYTFSGNLMTDAQNKDPYFTKEWYLKILDKELKETEENRKFIYGLVDTAFSVPRLFRESQREDIVPTFAEYAYKKCVEMRK